MSVGAFCRLPLLITLLLLFRAAVENTSIAAFLDAIRSTLDRSVQLILIVLPTNKKDMYDAIKKQCCVEAPVVTQCVTFNTLKKDRGLMSVVSKIVIQINCKLAGEAWALDIPVCTQFLTVSINIHRLL